MDSKTVWLYVRLIAVTMLWGGTFIAGRIVSAHISAPLAAFIRFLTASAFLFTVLFMRRQHKVDLNRQQMLLLVGAGMTGIFLYNIFFFSGLQTLEANRASLIVALNPVIVLVTAAVIGLERITGQRLIGVLVALFGVSIVLTEGNLGEISGSVGRGELFMLGCVVSWAAYTLIGRMLLKHLSPLVATTYACAVGTTALIVPAAQNIPDLFTMPLNAWVSVVYLGIGGTGLGFLWFYDGVRDIGPARTTVFINLVPAWAVIFAALLLREVIHPATLFGGALIITGVMLTNWRRRANVTKPKPSVQESLTNAK